VGVEGFLNTGQRGRIITADEARDEWESLLLELADSWSIAEFLADEWAKVILVPPPCCLAMGHAWPHNRCADGHITPLVRGSC
jgi:hypothetical protein